MAQTVTKAQGMVLEALQLTAWDNHDAEQMLAALGLRVSSRRVGRAIEPIIEITTRIPLVTADLSVIEQWFATDRDRTVAAQIAERHRAQDAAQTLSAEGVRAALADEDKRDAHERRARRDAFREADERAERERILLAKHGYQWARVLGDIGNPDEDWDGSRWMLFDPNGKRITRREALDAIAKRS